MKIDLIKADLRQIRFLATEYSERISNLDASEARQLEKLRKKGVELYPNECDFLDKIIKIKQPILDQINYFAFPIAYELARSGSSEDDIVDVDKNKALVLKKLLPKSDTNLLKAVYDLLIEQVYFKSSKKNNVEQKKFRRLTPRLEKLAEIACEN